MRTEDIIPRLVSEFGYTDKEAASVAGDLQALSPKIQAIFEKWWRNNIADENLKIQGFTLKLLINAYVLNPISAALTLQWLIDEPKEALKAIAQGYDAVTSPPITDHKAITQSQKPFEATSRTSKRRQPTPQHKHVPQQAAAYPEPGSQKAKRGGQAVREKYGPDFYSKIGKIGGQTVKEKRGPQFYSEIGKKGGEMTKRQQGLEFYSRIGKIGGERGKNVVPESG